jgi:pimeloyl-ACP methyl ester carboxylesterase
MLADQFAAAGYPVLRFDYPGTGDSGDIEGEPWAEWRQSVHAAADWLRRSTGARRVIFCGLRIGGTLAALAAASRADAAGLILLAPVLRGHSYMRQLSIEAQLQNGAPAADGRLDFHELHFSAQTVALIGKADLRHLRFSAGFPIAVFAQSPSTVLTNCVESWTRSGAVVTAAGFDGLAPMLRHNLVEACDAADFAQLIDWVRAAIPARPAGRPAQSNSAMLRLLGCTETPLRFGPDCRLFGMLCQPDHGQGKLAVIITNAGRDPHYGFARFGVEFARRLAASGVASLRFDFAGLGDSLGPPGQENLLSHVFETDRTPDISAALDALEARGYRDFAIQGLCAGAYHGLHAAVADPRIATVLLINLPVFVWSAGDTIDFFNQKQLTAGHLLSQLSQRSWWGRLIRGKVPLGTLLRAQLVRQWRRIRATRLARLGRPTPAQRIMNTLSARHARILFLVSPVDSAADMVREEFGAGGDWLRDYHGAVMKIVPGLDHQLSTPAMRQDAIALMLAFLPPGHEPANAAPIRIPYPVAS